ncbi:hypothetical protein [Krasilnikovia sp. MM14-A1004]|uniref:hypothetical protein n=1 Tax=Krasilnikovia sp. MM14-A1004 TaxID=3373541 RepID=UPI00399C93F1
MTATNWDNYNLPAIAAMLEGENACTGADRVLAWEGLATSVREQHGRLLKAAEDLAAVWPPEKNASASGFQRRIARLADSMTDTLTCAEDTRVGLRGVLDAIGTAQNTIRTLADGRAEVSEDWVPRFIDHAEDEYDEQAQQVMREAEAAIRDHNPQIRAPLLYRMEPGSGDIIDLPGEPDGGGPSSGAGTVHAQPRPVAVPHHPVLVGEPPHGPGAAPGSLPGHDPSAGVGPGLAGSTITPTGPLPGQGPGGYPGGSAAGGALPGAVIGGGGSAGYGLIAGAGGAGTLGALGAGGAGAFGTPGAGGVGAFGAPAGGTGVPGGPAAAASRQSVPVRRGLPSGAVIGADGQGPGAGRGQAPFGAPGQRAGRRGEDGTVLPEGDADQQWATADGGPAVIVPDATVTRHDPGPGVLGFPR